MLNLSRHPPGAYVRWLVLIGVLSYVLYVIVVGIKAYPPSENAIYICDTNNDEMLTQCQGLDDETSCADLVDPDGNVASCIQSSCGYKLFDHIDVSVAGSANPYVADDANNPKSFLSVMSIFYGLVPYLMVFIYGLSFLWSGDIVPLTRLLVIGVLALINDEILKRIVEQRRPIGSCLYFKSFGMPSGHSATSIGLLVYLLLELFLFHPNLMCGLTCQKKSSGDEVQYYFAKGYGWHKRVSTNNNVEPEENIGDYTSVIADGSGEERLTDIEVGRSTPNPSTSSSSDSKHVLVSVQQFLQGKWKYHLYGFLYCLLLFPVPFSRVYLYDHTTEQVVLGSVEGFVAASIWYLCVIRMCGARCMKWFSELKMVWPEIWVRLSCS
jgi:membrane-associated phospholipid phosphatase